MLPLEIKNKKPDFKRLMFAVAMVACVINSAWGAEGYFAPKSDVTLTGDNLTVGDIFAGVDHDANFVLGPAPGFGQTMTLSAKDLQRVSDTFNIGWNSSTGLEQTVVHRSSHDVDRYAIEAAVRTGMQDKVKGEKFDVELSERNMSFHLPENVPATAEADDLRYDLSEGTFHAVIAAPAGSTHPIVKQEISGKIFPVISVPVLKTAMREGDKITANDIDYVDMRSANVASSTIVDAARLIGMSPRRAVQPLKPIAQSEIAMPQIVKKGDSVVMELKSGTMILTVLGKALDSGAEGESVRVQNPSSNHVVQAVVTGTKAVSVSAPEGIGADSGT